MKVTLVGFGLSNKELFKRIRDRYEIFVSETRRFTKEEKELLEGVDFEEEHSEKILESDLIVVSPGIPPSSKVGKLILESKVGHGTEADKAFELLDLKPGKIVGVTGTNGKTTTTSMIAHVLRKLGFRVFLGGNNENPVSRMESEYDFTVLELSSFQLFWAERFNLDVGLITNISHDHLDWHGSFENYLKSKLRIVEFSEETLVGPSLSGSTDARVFEILDPKDVPRHLRTRQNVENVSATVAALEVLGFERFEILEALEDFKNPAHRMEFVGRIGNVSFYNDSKATNAHAVEIALSNFDPEDVVLIVSGILKEDPSRLKNILKGLKGVVVLGEKMGKSLGMDHVDTMEEAVELALEMTGGDGVVLFSPGGASFDMFKNYADRGEAFKKAVEGLKVER